ncbi:hypothetical protein [Treponema pectinovorum]|uniref:hypothetical protein n=1 Tax=Treponema pectinovorum TaxID=164 RepID=UPI0011CA82FA|nr:hypothetical protein [Treponema pectinovorum]
MKKGFISIVIVLLFSGFVFYLGFVSFSVPAGKYAVMTSKTSGVYKSVIENSKFTWRWEKVIPKNASLYVFSLEPYVCRKSFTGALPSADIYSSLVMGNPDFKYKFDFDIYLKIEKENLVDLVKNENVKNQEELDNFLEATGAKISQDLSQYIIKMNENTVIASYDIQEILKDLDFSKKYPLVKVTSVTVKNASVPDLNLYNIAKNSYEKFQDLIDKKLAEAANEQSQRIMSDERSLKKLEKIGELLKKYPELNSLFSNSTTAEVIKSLNELK